MAHRGRRSGGFGGMIAALLGLGVLMLGGFALGLVLGAIWEEPGLVVGHLAGETEEVPWELEAGTDEPPAPPPPAGAAPAREVVREAAPARIAPARRPAEVSAAPSRAGRFAIQVGAFAQSASAQRLADGLREKGMDVYLSPGTQDGVARWRVRVGPLASRAEAERLAARIKTDEKLPTWVLQEGGR